MINNKRRFFLRYISIIQKLKTKDASFDEIKSFLKNQSKDTGEELAVSKRTFQRDLNDIRDIFGIVIKADSSGIYSIADDDDSARKLRILETFDHLDLLYKMKNPSKYIFYEKRLQSGSQHFHGVLHAIHNRYLLSYTYEKFWGDSITYRAVEPLALKESHHRWYLIAKDRKDKVIKSFGLDRMKDLIFEKEKFEYPKNFDTEEMFRDSFGVITSKVKPEEIILSFDPDRRKYLGSLRIHGTQEVLVDNSDEYRIKLKMHITIDLIGEILSYGEAVEVIAPKNLIKEVQKRYKNALKQY